MLNVAFIGMLMDINLSVVKLSVIMPNVAVLSSLFFESTIKSQSYWYRY